MDGARRDRLERMLREKRDALRRELLDVIEERLSTDDRDRLLETIEVGDRSVQILDEDVELGVLELRKRELGAIELTLERLSRDAYGRCEDCEGDIEEARLEIVPFATRCVDCQRATESSEAPRRSTPGGFRSGFDDLRDREENEE